MEISINEEHFYESQAEMLGYLARSIKQTLQEKEVDEDSLYDITGDLMFAVCTVIDGSAVMGTEEKPVLPYLTFSKSLEEKENLVASASGSSLHEIAYGCVEELFE